MTFGRQCSEAIAAAELKFHEGKIEESRWDLSLVLGTLETFRDNPDMTKGWTPIEISDFTTACLDMKAAWERIYRVWQKRPPQWH